MMRDVMHLLIDQCMYILIVTLNNDLEKRYDTENSYISTIQSQYKREAEATTLKIVYQHVN